MAWSKSAAAITTTKHTCGGPVFGRRAPLGQCKRCDELTFGMPAVQWASKRTCEAAQIAAIRAHDCKVSRCGPVCTFGDW
jgi:hypothetical protein